MDINRLQRINEILRILKIKPGYIKWSSKKLSESWDYVEDEISAALTLAKRNIFTIDIDLLSLVVKNSNEYQFKNPKWIDPFIGGNPENILCIPDLHEPFSIENAIEFVREQQEKWNCGTVIFMGDVIDNHYSSYHENEQEALNPTEELNMAIQRLKRWHYTFPNAHVLIGNHDRIIQRKCKTLGISTRWMKDFNEALEVLSWEFVESLELFGINFNHGEGGTAKTRMRKELQSQVQGHLHSQAYVEWAAGSKYKIFGMQTGCLIDRKKYAFAYGKNGPKPIIGCGVILNKGTLPFFIPMEL